MALRVFNQGMAQIDPPFRRLARAKVTSPLPLRHTRPVQVLWMLVPRQSRVETWATCAETDPAAKPRIARKEAVMGFMFFQVEGNLHGDYGGCLCRPVPADLILKVWQQRRTLSNEFGP
jgi:hypothetical protein